MVYILDGAVLEEHKRARILTQKLNTVDRSDFEQIEKIVKELLGKSKKAFINPPFYCDYGSHIEVGKNFFANYNCTILDVAKVKIGDNCQMAPNGAIYTARHPIYPDTRNSGYEYGVEVVIGDNVWIGGNTVICPGVHIGNNVVIGAGSVVTGDIPDWTVAAGNNKVAIKPLFIGFMAILAFVTIYDLNRLIKGYDHRCCIFFVAVNGRTFFLRTHDSVFTDTGVCIKDVFCVIIHSATARRYDFNDKVRRTRTIP